MYMYVHVVAGRYGNLEQVHVHVHVSEVRIGRERGREMWKMRESERKGHWGG